MRLRRVRRLISGLILLIAATAHAQDDALPDGAGPSGREIYQRVIDNKLETAYFEKGRFSEMGRMYEEMLARNPRDVRILLALARMYIKKGELTEASRTLNEALEIDPRSKRVPREYHSEGAAHRRLIELIGGEPVFDSLTKLEDELYEIGRRGASKRWIGKTLSLIVEGPE